MKQIILTVTALVLALALCACNGGGNSGTTLMPTSSNPAQANTGESMQANTGELTQANTGESSQANTGESMQANTGESTQANTGESTQANTGESTQTNTGESMQANIGELTQANAGESTQANIGESTQTTINESTQRQGGRGDLIDDEPMDDGRGDLIDDEPMDDGRGDIFDSPIPAGADGVIMQDVFYFELAETSGDYGDGLSPREGAELVNDLLSDIGLYSGNGIPAGQCVYISFDEISFLDSVMGRECYIYSVGLGNAEYGLMGYNYEVIYRVSVDYSGNKTAAIYEDFIGEGEYYEPNDAGWGGDGRGDIVGSNPAPGDGGDGRGDMFGSDPGDGGNGRGDIFGSDPGDGDDGLVAWWGTYVSSGYSVDITEVDISSFYFVIRMITTTQNTVVLEGWAEIDETGYFAMSEDMGFSLYNDFSAIDIFISENSEWANLRGQYEYID